MAWEGWICVGEHVWSISSWVMQEGVVACDECWMLSAIILVVITLRSKGMTPVFWKEACHHFRECVAVQTETHAVFPNEANGLSVTH